MLKFARTVFMLACVLWTTLGIAAVVAQQPAGRVWTQQEVFRRNVGSREEQTTAFTPRGHLLINSSYEVNVPVLKSSVEKLGFRWTDVKILLGSHAHGDHMEGDAAVKQQTGATVVAMAEDVPALEKMRPGEKPHPIDRVIHDGDAVTLGGTTLVAHLTPGHTRGCTTWTMKVQDGGRTLDVVIIGSAGVNPGFVLANNRDTPQIADEFRSTFQILRSLPCDIPLASHPAMYNLAEKFPKLGKGPNPFIDPAGYTAEIDIAEGVFKQVWTEQGGK